MGCKGGTIIVLGPLLQCQTQKGAITVLSTKGALLLSGELLPSEWGFCAEGGK